jgi:hypothetical protein
MIMGTVMESIVMAIVTGLMGTVIVMDMEDVAMDIIIVITQERI